MNIDGNTILITGGASGIGLALAKVFIASHNTVIICGRDAQKLKAVQLENPKIITYVCDISVAEERLQLFETLRYEQPTLNIMINNAGIQHNYNFLDKPYHDKKIDEEININFSSQIQLIDLFLPHLMWQKNAAIVNVTSALAFVPKESAPVYCATKAGFHAFSVALRYQLEKSTIKIFEIIPPLVDTGMTQGRGTKKITPEALATEALKGMENDTFEIKIGKTKILLWLHRFLPFMAQKIIRHG